MGTNYIAPIWRMPRNANKDKLSNYNIDFNPGDSNYIDCGDSDLLSFGDSVTDSPFSISAWINMDSATNFRIVSKYDAPNYEYQFDVGSSNKLQFYIFDGSNYRGVGYDTALNTGEWYHVIATYDGSGSSSGMTLYLNGLAVNDVTFSNGSYTAMHNTTATVKIGRIASSYADGKISQVCIFGYALNSTQVTYLYNLNNPMAITGGEPVAYWPLGDNSNPNAPGSFPNISVGADSVFDFDGSNYITAGDINIIEQDDNGSLPYSISLWVNIPYSNSTQVLLSKQPNGGSYNGFNIYRNNTNIYFILGSLLSPQARISGYASFSDYFDTWVNICLTYDGSRDISGFNLYFNKESQTINNTANQPPQNVLNTADFEIGSRGGGTLKYIGEISNVQLWNTELSSSQVETLYNNGQPLMTGTQPQETNLQAWYKLNQSANYDPGVGPFSIEKVGSPDDGSGNGCFTSGGQLKWIDTNSQLLSENDYFTFLSPLILCNSTDVDLSSTGGAFQSASSQLEYALEYSIDGGSWTTWKTQVVSSGTPVTNWTVSAASNLTCNSSIQVRLRATGGLFGTSQFNWNDLEIKVNNNRVYFETFGTNGLGWTNGSYTAPTDNYIDPSWQIPDNRSAYPQSFDFSKTPQEYIDLGKDDWFNEYNNEITFSLWVNKKDWSSTGFEGIISKYGNAGAAIQYRIAYPSSSGRLQFYLQGGPSGGPYSARIDNVILTSAQQASEWLHILWRHNANTGVSEVIFNGDYTNLVSLTNIAANPYAQPQTTTTNMIGNVANGLQPFDGAISNYQRFNSFLDNATVESLYNDGVPSATAIAPTSSQAWYKLDNTELFDGTNWSVENQKYPANWESSFNSSLATGMLRDNDSKSEYDNQLFSISVWVKPKSGVATSGDIFSCKGSSWQGVSLAYTSNDLLFQIGDKNTTAVDGGSPANNGNWSFYQNRVENASPNYTKYDQWSHIAVVWNGTNSKFYINGDLVSTITPPSSLTIDYSFAVTISAIGGRNDANGSYFTGNISNLAYWESELDQTAVTALYNNGTPEVTISQSPNHWFTLKDFATGSVDQIGSLNYENTLGVVEFIDNFVSTEAVLSSELTEQSLVNNNVSVFNGESEGMNSTNLVTSNISRTQPYSNYSFNFDSGQSDYFDCGDADIFSFVGATNDEPFSVSAWVNFDDVTGNRGIIGKYGTTDTRREWLFYIAGSQLRLLLRRGASYRAKTGGTTFVANTWYHLLGTYDGRGGDDADNGIKLYVNGLAETLTDLNNGSYIGMQNTVEPVDIGRFNNTAYIDGKISNTALFDRVLTEDEILNIYNNGVPQDLQATSSFSNNIIAWWPMDENSSYYDGTDWIIRDLENGNDGDGNNTGNVNDLVGNAPGSDASGTGNNLAIADLIGDMKDSKLNAYSINMADYADGVTNPANSGRSTDTP